MLAKYAILVLCLLGTVQASWIEQKLEGIEQRFEVQQRMIAAEYRRYETNWPAHADAGTFPTRYPNGNDARWLCRCGDYTEYTQDYCEKCKMLSPFGEWQIEYKLSKKEEENALTQAPLVHDAAVKAFKTKYDKIHPVVTGELITFKNATGKRENVPLPEDVYVRRMHFKKTTESCDRPALNLDSSYVRVTRPAGCDMAGLPYETQREFTENARAIIKDLEPGFYDVFCKLEFEGESIWTCSGAYSARG